MVDDPRRVQGEIAGGTDDPYGKHDVVIDASNALMLHATDMALLEGGGVHRGDGERVERQVLALSLYGRINQTDEMISVMVITEADGAAALVTEIIALASRAGWGDEFVDLVFERMKDAPT